MIQAPSALRPGRPPAARWKPGAAPSRWLLGAARFGLALQHLARTMLSRVRSRDRDDRGDVPGWVLVTLMTAGLVLVLWGVARERLIAVFNHAIDGVMGGP